MFVKIVAVVTLWERFQCHELLKFFTVALSASMAFKMSFGRYLLIFP